MIFLENEQKKVIDRYTRKYNEFGYSQKTLGWDKGKQEIRFDILSSTWDFKDKSILDIGCGFGDLYRFLTEKFGGVGYYKGLDLVPVLVAEGETLYAENENFSIEIADFLEWKMDRAYDYILISGLFNFKLESKEANYNFIKSIIKKSFANVNIGVGVNFLSNRVDYEHEHTFHTDPVYMLEFGYNLTKNILLRNDYFPFEFSLFLDKRENFNASDTIFESFKNVNSIKGF